MATPGDSAALHPRGVHMPLAPGFVRPSDPGEAERDRRAPYEGSILSRPTARHRMPSSSENPAARAAGRHRNPPRFASARRHRLLWAGAALACSVLVISAWPGPNSWMGDLAGRDQAAALNLAGTRGRPSTHASGQPGGPPAALRGTAAARRTGAARDGATHAGDQPGLNQAPRATPAPPVYRNPFRGISGLIPERIDMGVDFGGSGPVYALGDAIITNATGSSAGWPGGGWITYQLTNGPAAGLMVFVAEDVRPTVQVGQHVSSSTVIATMSNWGDGIETGWARPDGFSAESQLLEAGGISGGGPFPTIIGLNFEELLQSLGVPAANNRAAAPSGILPARFPARW